MWPYTAWTCSERERENTTPSDVTEFKRKKNLTNFANGYKEKPLLNRIFANGS
jgi:hypothetical protein